MRPDSVLVQQVRDGVTDAYEHLVMRYRRAAMLTAMRVLRDHHAAEDVVQDSFVVAYERLDSLRDPSKFGGWLMRIVGRQSLRTIGKQRPIACPQPMQEYPEAIAKPDRHGCERLIELINRLPSHERVVVTLRHLDGHSTAEIAEITGRPSGTVTKQLSRAMQRLRDMASLQRSSP